MASSQVAAQDTPVRRQIDVRTVLAFFAIWVIWGATFYAVRVAVLNIPPFFAAGVRFSIAGVILYAGSRLRGAPGPTRVQWRWLTLIGGLMFMVTYSGLFWAEQRIPSGMAALMVATLPISTALLEIFVLRTETFRPGLIGAIVLGLGGVSVLTFHGGDKGTLNTGACFIVIVAEMAWAVGATLSKRVALPQSKTITAGAQMATGGLLLLVCAAAAGEMHPFPHFTTQALWAMAFLIGAGSLISYTAYVWLLARLPLTQVSSHAYVNPLVALLVGWALGGETIGWRTAAGACLIVGSVVLLLRGKR